MQGPLVVQQSHRATLILDLTAYLDVGVGAQCDVDWLPQPLSPDQLKALLQKSWPDDLEQLNSVSTWGISTTHTSMLLTPGVAGTSQGHVCQHYAAAAHLG